MTLSHAEGTGAFKSNIAAAFLIKTGNSLQLFNHK